MPVHIKKRSMSMHSKQRGVVLLLTLLILVAMTLAGIGMMRSVDTATVVAGNLAFKQATTNAADGGTSSGFNTLATVANTATAADKLVLGFDPGQPCPVGLSVAIQGTYCPAGVIVLNGYQSTPINTCEVTNTCAGTPKTTAGAAITGCPAGATQPQWYQCTGSWNGAPTVNIAATGTTVSYLIHRMCTLANQVPAVPDPATPGSQSCQTYTPSSTSKGGVIIPGIPSFYYRITSRSVGPRNTVTYTQTLVLIAV